MILLPLTYNDGTTIPSETLDQIYEDFFVLAGGHYTAGTGKGAYRMTDGSKQVDNLVEVWVAVDEVDEPELRELVANICGLLKQETLYCERVMSTVEFIPPNESGG